MSLMSPSQENSRERLQTAIDAEIKSLEESIRALKLRRNALSPISSLPPELFTAIFSLLCLPGPSPLLGEISDHHQARLCVSHVCHQWREIALNQPLLWSNVDFTILSLAGATEILARAKSVPLHLEARVLSRRHWHDARFSAIQKELQARLPDVCHLSIGAEVPGRRIHRMLEGLVSPAPTLEYLSLSSRRGYQNAETGDELFVPDTLFDGVAPRLSCLKLFNCKISWKSPLLKGLRHLEIRSPNERPKFATWLNALNEMSQLKTLILHLASPIASQSDAKNTTTLPFLTHLGVLASPADCALALAHLDLPALTELSVTVAFHHSNSRDIHVLLLPPLARHANGPQDTQPLQSMLLRSDGNGAKILAWSVPDIDVAIQNPPTFLAPTFPSPRVAVTLFFTGDNWYGDMTQRDVLDATLTALPLSGLVTLLVQEFITPPDTRFWLQHAPTWPLLRRVLLEARVQYAFIAMLLESHGWSPLLPALTELGFVGLLAQNWPLVLTRRKEQGVPLERLDLRMCVTRSPEEVPSLCEMVVEVLGPEDTAEMRERMTSRWKTVVCAPFGEEIDFEEGYNVYTSDSESDEDEDHE